MQLSQMPEFFALHNFAAPLYVVLIAVETFLIARRKIRGRFDPRDSWTSMFMGLGSIVIPILFALIFASVSYATLLFIYGFAPMKWEFSFLTFVICFVLNDIKYYWWHRFSHTIRWGWANHVVHHSSRHFNLSTALRQPWFSFTTGYFVLAVPLVLLGFHPGMIAFAASINLVYQFFIHTEAVDKLHPWIEKVFNTPSHHRLHHCRNPQFLDCNFAGVFIIWDRLFGTFVEEPCHAVKENIHDYGLVTSIASFNPLFVATHEYLAMAKDALQPSLTPWQRIAYLFCLPGWRHDGEGRTTKTIKREFYANAQMTNGQLLKDFEVEENAISAETD